MSAKLLWEIMEFRVHQWDLLVVPIIYFFGCMRPFKILEMMGQQPKFMPQSLISIELEMYRHILGKTSIMSEGFGGSHALVGGRRS